MARKKKNKISVADIVIANRKGEYQANKDIPGRLRASAYKNKKRYSRKRKHNTTEPE
jgi:hypothetical protein